MWPGFLKVISDGITTLLAALEGDGLPVTDRLLTGIAEGQTTAGASAVVATAQTGGGYLTVLNTSTTDGAYITWSGATASATKFLLAPGASDTSPIADVTQVKCYAPSGSPVLSWKLLRAS
jgi:hypothetical protein